jgi:two-component system cell cycle sensor histidine kinase PleC
MARASAVDASVQTGARRDSALNPGAVLRRLVSFAQRADLELLVRWAVPAVLVAFVAILITISFTVTVYEQDRIVASATTDIALVAAVVADDVDLRLRDATDHSPSEALLQAIPAHAVEHGQRILLTDQTGKVIAGYPDTHMTGSIADHVGASTPLTIFGEKAGVMRLTLPDGTDALATARTLHEPLGQITIIHPMADVLKDWRAALLRTIVLLVCTAAVLGALALAYFWQATRARLADTSCRTMRDRVDMVLTRGRCGLLDWDLASGHVDWSLSMYEILGMVPRAKALSFSEISSLIHPDDGGLNAMIQTASLGASNAIDHTFRIRNAAGGWVWLRAKAELVQGDGTGPRLVGIAIDITETVALEERTARADMRLRDAIETISEAFVVWDADNRLVMCNSKFQRFHNLPADAVAVGSPYASVMERGTAPLIQSHVALGEAQPMGARTFEAQLGDGRWLQIDERRTKDGGYVSVGTDITALKRNEEQLMDSERRLMNSVVDLRKSRQILETQAQQLAELAEKYLEQKAEAESANRAKSDFLANMSHELRTPLNAILGFSEIMMLESYGALGSPLYSEYCKDIHNSGQHLLSVIADVLEMSRLEAGRVRLEKENFQIGTAIDAAVANVSAEADANAIAITMDAQRDLSLVADRSAVEKILTILLNNAVKYTPAQGAVTVRARLVQGAVNLYVEDTGVGITPDAIARLGKPFEQTEQSLRNGLRGSGLGLAIARSLVDLHGGTMRIRSQPSAGTVVLVQIPNRPISSGSKPQGVVDETRVINQSTRFALQRATRAPKRMARVG